MLNIVTINYPEFKAENAGLLTINEILLSDLNMNFTVYA